MLKDEENVSLFWRTNQKSFFVLGLLTKLCWIWETLTEGVELHMLSTGGMRSKMLRNVNVDSKPL